MPTTKEMIRAYMDEVERLEEEARSKKRFRAVEGFPFWPHQFLRDMTLVLIFVAGMIYLSAFVPYYLEMPADPAGQPEVILPDWYLLWSYGLLKIAVTIQIFGVEIMTGDLAGVLLNGVVVGFMIIVPFISRGAPRRPTQAPAMAGYGVFGMLLGITLSAYSVDVLLMDRWGFLARDLWVEAGLTEVLHLLQTNVLSLLTIGIPIIGGVVTYFFMKWRGSIKDGIPGYEHKLSASYYKIR
jgi:quinol-cytochrome oxidoreductase complex cytochrome b subunit